VVTVEFGLILAGLFLVALLYSSVGHGGGSGYLAILSLTSYGTMEAGWLKQYAWCLNLIVAGIAFWHYSKAGHHMRGMTVPLVVASVPFALIGGYLRVDGALYDTLLSVTLIWAAWRLLLIKRDFVGVGVEPPDPREALPVGGAIGLASGVIGVGGGIFLSPVILLRHWATPKAAAATAAAFIWLNSAAGLAGAGLSGQLQIELEILGVFGVAVLSGGLVGSRYGAGVAPQMLVRNLLVAVLLVAASRRVLSAFSL